MFDHTFRQRARARAAPTFSHHDFLYRESAMALLDRLDLFQKTFERIAYVGDPSCDGGLFQGMQERYGVQALVSVRSLEDLSGAFNALITPLNLHWEMDLAHFLAHIRGLLKPDGLFLGALLGQGTLHELRASFLRAEMDLSGGAAPRVIPLCALQDLASLMQRAGFALPVVDRDVVVVHYATPRRLMHDLRGMGETNALTQRSRIPLKRAVLSAMERYYHNSFPGADGGIAATFECMYLTGWAPSPKQQQPLKRGCAVHSLRDALV